MTYTFKLSRRLAISQCCPQYYRMLLIPLLALHLACAGDPASPLDPDAPPPGDPAAEVVVAPKSVTAETNQSIQFQAHGRPADGTTSAGDTVAVDWTSSGGAITPLGVFSSSETGTFKVVARRRGHSMRDTATVTVVSSPPALIEVVVSPATATVAAGGQLGFSASGRLADSSTATVGVVWSATGGSIDASGRYTAGTVAGTYRVIATGTAGVLADTASVTVSAPAPPPPSLVAVVLTPLAPSLVEGTTQQFAAVGRMSDGSGAPVSVVYAATGGTVTGGGLYTAGRTPGSYRVVATLAGGTLADTSQISVVSGQATTQIFPGQSIQAAVDAYPAGTAFTIKAGVHRLQQVAPKSGDSFTGEAGAVLSGARLLTSFTRSGSYWVASGQTQEGVEHGECEAAYPRCTRPEDLFIDNVLLRHVGSLSEVGPGRWYFDYPADQIYFADNPAGRTVEAGVTPNAFKSSASDVTIRNLVIEKYASPNSEGTINGSSGDRWMVEDNVVRWNHGSGIRTGDYMVARRNKTLYNGHYGFNGQGSNVLVEGNEIAYNSTTGVNPFWGAGGSKWTRTYRLTVRNNFVHHNRAKGLWTDIDNRETLYEGNVVEDNAMAGIFHEISYSAIIRNNRCSRNGFGIPQKLRGGGIAVTSSSDVEIYGNTLINNNAAFVINQDDRGAGAYGTYEVRNLYVHDNIVTMASGYTGLGLAMADNGVYTTLNNRFVNNVYYLGSNAKYFWWQGQDRTEAEWKAFGQDLTGKFTR